MLSAVIELAREQTNIDSEENKVMRKINPLILIGLLLAFAAPVVSFGQASVVTFHEDIEPILQRSCQSCHRDGGVGPMPLISYDQVAPFAGLIEYKTSIRDRAGDMPPWYWL